jgi:hypothetical protein
MMSIAAGITATKAFLDVRKMVSDLIERPHFDAAEVRNKLHEMLIHVVNIQTAVADTQVEITELRQQLDDRGMLKALQADLEMDPVARYWVRKSEKELGLIPYCPTCWGSDSKLVPLAIRHHPGTFECAIHKTLYHSAEQLEHNRQESVAIRPPRGRMR